MLLKHTLLFVGVALFLSACGTARDEPPHGTAPPRAVQTPNFEEPITWVLVLIDLNLPTPALTIEGSYDRMDKCFFKREAFIPGYPKPGTQGICIQMKRP